MLLKSPRKKIFITGSPGTGKTTLVKYLHSFLKNTSLPFNYSGFITEEIREKGERKGFKLKLLNSQEEYLLAQKKHKSSSFKLKHRPFVGRYEVFLENLEKVVVHLEKEFKERKADFFIIDEIGKMEALSPLFCSFIESLLEAPVYLLATVGESSQPFLKKVRDFEPSLLCKITPENRNFVKKRLELEFVRKGRLIVVEGIDGAGKTTLSKALHKRLKEKGIDCIFSCEPTTGPYGKELRNLLKKEKLSPQELTEYFLKDRRWHVENIILPALEDGKWIVLDRYYLSTIAYQGAQGLSLKKLLMENETIAPSPDLIIFLNIPVELAIERVNKRGEELSIFEKKEFLRRVSEIYHKFLPWYNHIICDATLPVELNLKKILEHLNSEFKSAFT